MKMRILENLTASEYLKANETDGDIVNIFQMTNAQCYKIMHRKKIQSAK